MIAVIYYPGGDSAHKGLAACFAWATDAAEFAKKESSAHAGIILNFLAKM